MFLISKLLELTLVSSPFVKRTGPLISTIYLSIRGTCVLIPSVVLYLTKLLPRTIFCVGLYTSADASYNPIVPIAFFLSNGYAPPPIDNPFLPGVTIFKNVLDELSDAIKERAFPVLEVDTSYTLYAYVLLQISYITAVSLIICALASRLETVNLEATYVLSETSMIKLPPF